MKESTKKLIDELKEELNKEGYNISIMTSDKKGNATYDLIGLHGIQPFVSGTLEEAEAKALFNRMPVVFNKQENKWTVTMELFDWVELHKSYTYCANIVGLK